MKSIKPGRGPSMMKGVMSIIIGAFGIAWTIMVASSGGGFFALFGGFFVIAAVIQAIYNFKNATGKNRYSAFDITDSTEESDPLNERYGASVEKPAFEGESADAESRYCPYCGTPVKDDFDYCYKCGKKLP